MTLPSTGAWIIGVGTTDFSKNSGRSEQRLALEAIRAALLDAEVDPKDVTGLVTFTLDNTRAINVAASLGLSKAEYFAEVPFGGGGGCGSIMFADLAIRAGIADIVVCYRAFNERSQTRFGQPYNTNPNPHAVASGADLDKAWVLPFGLSTPASILALSARRYMYEYGATSEDFGRVSVAARHHAATNPDAFFYQRPITLEDHQASRMISDPLRLLDCCQESDAGVAFVVASADIARNARHPVRVTAGAQGFGEKQHWVGNMYQSSIAGASETRIMGDKLWERSGLTPEDMDVVLLYDHFTPAVLFQLEALGFCKPGQAPDFIREEGITVGEALPVNTHGGQVGEAYVHGMNGIAEGVRQVRGTAANQVDDVEHVVVTSGTHLPTSGLILSQP